MKPYIQKFNSLIHNVFQRNKTSEALNIAVSPSISPDPSESKVDIEDEDDYEDDFTPNSKILEQFSFAQTEILKSDIDIDLSTPPPTPPKPIEKLIAPPIREKPKPKTIEKLVSRPKPVEKYLFY